MLNRLIILWFLGLLGSCGTTPSDSGTAVEEAPIVTAMNVHADTLLQDSMLTAVSIGIYKDGKTYIGHYGELDEGNNNPPTDETLYEIGSVSKTMAGLLVAQAEADGKLGLDDDVRTFLDGDYSNLAYNNNPITIRHLITHTSRLPRFLPDSLEALFSNIDAMLPFRMTEIQKTYSRTAFLEDLKAVVLDTTPGIVYEYSNVAPELLAHILEQVYDQSYEDLLHTYLFDKAGMPNATTQLNEAILKQQANGYGEGRQSVPYLIDPLWGAAGGVRATMPDLVNYMKFQLDTENAVAQAAYSVAYEEGNAAIGYYWRIHSDEVDGTYYGHHGGTLGMQNWFFIFPKHKLGVSIVTNQSDQITGRKLVAALNAILDDIR